MFRTFLRRTIGTLLAIAVMVPGLAAASDRDDILDMAGMFRDLGYPSEAAQIEQLAAGMSDSELQLLGDLGFATIKTKLQEYIDRKQEVDAAELLYLPSPSFSATTRSGHQRSLLEDYDLVNFPDADYPPSNATCFSPVGTTTSASIKVGFKATFFAAREALIAADGLQRAAIHGCNVIVIAIGVGGNAASACIISGLAIGVLDAILAGFENIVDTVIFCDEQVHFAESEGSENRAAFLSHQVEQHDLDLEEQIATHDDEVQAKLLDAIARATSIENKVDRGLKTQLEVAMDRRTVTRPSIFYEDRLDELCDLAQEAIDDLPPAYILATKAQQYVDDGMQFKVTDPKRAADECIRGFSMATTGSFVLQ